MFLILIKIQRKTSAVQSVNIYSVVSKNCHEYVLNCHDYAVVF